MHRKFRLPSLAFLGAVMTVGLNACIVDITYIDDNEPADLEINWTVDGQVQSPSLCSQYNIATWHVDVTTGGVSETADVPCAEPWTTGPAFVGGLALIEGSYTVTVTARDANGAQLATLSREIILLYRGGTQLESFAFTATNFGAVGPVCGNNICDSGETTATCSQDCKATTNPGQVTVAWTINGSAVGASWDTCAEVGADKAVVTLDGTSTSYTCDANSMSTALTGLTVGNHEIKVKLIDASGTDLTTETTKTVNVTATGSTEIFDFPYTSFAEPKRSSTKGTFLFKTTFEGGKNCSGTNPDVGAEVVLLRMDGTPVTTQVCSDASCSATDGADWGVCWNNTINIKNLTWGAYKIRIQGATAGNTTVCWSTKNTADNSSDIPIIVGAGDSNPTVTIDLSRVDTTSTECLGN